MSGNILNFITINIRKNFGNLRLLMQRSSFDMTTEEGRSKERYRRIALTTSASVISKGVSIFTTLISVPLTVNYLGTERYGLWMTISSVISMLGFADLGMGNGLLNAISEANGKDDRKTARMYVSSTFFMLVAISILILAVFVSVYGFIPWQRVFNVTSDLAAQESGPAMAVLVASFALNMPLGVAMRVRMGYQEDYKNQLWAIAGSLMGLSGVLLAIYLKAGLPWLILAISGGPVLAMLMNSIALFCCSQTWLFPQWKAFKMSAGKKIISTGIWFLIFQIFAVIGISSDNLIIAQALGASAVANYSVTQRLFATAAVSQFFLLPLWPAFGEAIARADYDWARRTLNRALVLSLGIGIVTAIFLLVFAKKIIAIWSGENLVPSTSLLIGFIFWLLLICCSNAITTFINSGYLLVKQLPFTAISCVISLALKIFLVNKWQASGVIWAGVFSYGFFYLIPASRLAYASLNKLENQ